jgi:hypothetical protein
MVRVIAEMNESFDKSRRSWTTSFEEAWTAKLERVVRNKLAVELAKLYADNSVPPLTLKSFL